MDYVRYRPSYPLEMFEVLRHEGVLRSGDDVADVGSGTGILSRLFLDRGHRVYGVEPNTAMREAAETYLERYARFVSVDGRAEATALPENSVDLVAASQAFHWFDPRAARREFQRILRPGGRVTLMWNVRRIEDVPAMASYQDLVDRYARDADPVTYRGLKEDDFASFFGDGGYQLRRLPNRQVLDREGLRGRLMSSSYAPEAGDPRCEPMLAELDDIFRRHQVDGHVTFEYDTRVYFGYLTEGGT